MAQLEKNTARRVLQGISILGILLGFNFVFLSITFVLGHEGDNPAILCGLLVLSAAFLGLGGYLVYTSYLMLRLRAFGAIMSISLLLALVLCGLVVEPVMSFAATLIGGELPRYIKVSGAFAALICLYLCVSLCIKLSRRLLEAAGIRPPGDFEKNAGNTGEHTGGS